MAKGPARSGVVSLLTDFGPGSVYVGQMHATIARIAPALRVVDLAHDCPFGNTESAAYILRRSYLHFPPGTVHVGVVGPGVSTALALELVGGREAIQDRTCHEALSALAGMLDTAHSGERREDGGLR